MSSKDKQAALAKQLADLQEEFRKASVSVFEESCQDFFDEFPDVDSFSWTQYTPWFNDGDTCVFSVHEDAGISVPGLTDVDNFEDEESGDCWLTYIPDFEWRREWNEKHPTGDRYPNDSSEEEAKYKERPWLQEAIDRAQAIVYSIPEEVMKSMFGDHVRVTVDRDGATTEEHSHD